MSDIMEQKAGGDSDKAAQRRGFVGERLEILILDDESIVGQRLKSALERDGFNVEVFAKSVKAAARLEEKDFDILITDILMEELDGMQILKKVRSKSPRTKVIVITGYATVDLANQAILEGAFDFIAKPFRVGTLRDKAAEAAKELEKEKAGAKLRK
jgi:DNA-binding NtrC family response regulator